MILSDILKKCLDYINENTLSNGGELGFPYSELGKKLKDCANACYSIIFSSFSRIVCIEDIYPTNGYLAYSDLEKRLNRVISVKKDGQRIPFVVTENGLKTDTDALIRIEYTYFPDALDLDSEVVLLDNISPECFVYLIVSEYWLREGEMERSNFFYEKFLMAKSNYGRTESKKLKVRRWL